jgi:hypothetical protein
VDQEKIKDMLWNCYVPLLVYTRRCISSNPIVIKQEDLEPFKNKIICSPKKTQSRFNDFYENPTYKTTAKLSDNLIFGILSYKAELNKLTASPIDYSCENCKNVPYIEFMHPIDGDVNPLQKYDYYYICLTTGSRITKDERQNKNRDCSYFTPVEKKDK